MNQRGNRTPPRLATAMVITTGSATRPRYALGKPSRCACHEVPTVPQLITELMLQARLAVGSAASVIASTESTNDATRLRHADASIVPKIQPLERLRTRSRASESAITEPLPT